jgi:hypothetical protein
MRSLELLEKCVSILQPFTDNVGTNTLRWDGSAFATTPPQAADPYALAWWASLRTAVELLGAQDRIAKSQFALLRRMLFGGMGAFNDFQLDTARWGQKGEAANKLLDQCRAELYECLNNDEKHVA